MVKSSWVSSKLLKINCVCFFFFFFGKVTVTTRICMNNSAIHYSFSLLLNIVGFYLVLKSVSLKLIINVSWVLWTRGHRASAHACPRRYWKFIYAPSRSGGKKHLILSSTWALASYICLRSTATHSYKQYFIKCSHLNVPSIAISTSEFSSDWNFPIRDLQRSAK